jgi:hypothetical protein
MRRLSLMIMAAVAVALHAAASPAPTSADTCLSVNGMAILPGLACASATNGVAIGVNVDGVAAVVPPDGTFVDESGAAALNGGVAIAVNGGTALANNGLAIGINGGAAVADQSFGIAIDPGSFAAGVLQPSIACNGQNASPGQFLCP